MLQNSIQMELLFVTPIDLYAFFHAMWSTHLLVSHLSVFSSCGPIDELSPWVINEGQRSTPHSLASQRPGYSQLKAYRMAFPATFLPISKGAYLRISLVRLRLCLRPDPLGANAITLDSLPHASHCTEHSRFLFSLPCVPSQSSRFSDSFPGKHSVASHKPTANRRCHSCGR